MSEYFPLLMPVLFLGHGSPMNALANNAYTRAWHQLGQTLPKPKAIVVISAHWLTDGMTLVTAMPQPRTIHDFGWFDPRLFQMEYPAPGSPALAQRLVEQMTGANVGLDQAWGLDHGSWCCLHSMYPAANIPVIQLSMDFTQPEHVHYQLARELAFLRREGVLVIGSGNIVHNLRVMVRAENHAFDWAKRFDQRVRGLIDAHDHEALVDYRELGEEAERAIPTPEHYWPLLYVLGLQEAGDTVSYPVEGFAHGSISMRSVLIQPSTSS
jgi:4,5-DOPA dioxygenase extradiol